MIINCPRTTRQVASFILLFISPKLFAQAPSFHERAEYDLTYLGISAVHITVDIAEEVIMDGRKAIHLVAIAKTKSLFAPVYTLENRYDTYMDPVTGLPFRYDKTIHQKTIDQTMHVRYTTDSAYYEGGKFDSSFAIATAERSHNLFSMIYALRRSPLKTGDTYTINLDIETERWVAVVLVTESESVYLAGKNWRAHKLTFKFTPVGEEKKRKHTDIVTRRLVQTQSNLVFWIGEQSPYPFLKVDYEMMPFDVKTNLTEISVGEP